MQAEGARNHPVKEVVFKLQHRSEVGRLRVNGEKGTGYETARYFQDTAPECSSKALDGRMKR